jgi:hypothetical protein
MKFRALNFHYHAEARLREEESALTRPRRPIILLCRKKTQRIDEPAVLSQEQDVEILLKDVFDDVACSPLDVETALCHLLDAGKSRAAKLAEAFPVSENAITDGSIARPPSLQTITDSCIKMIPRAQKQRTTQSRDAQRCAVVKKPALKVMLLLTAAQLAAFWRSFRDSMSRKRVACEKWNEDIRSKSRHNKQPPRMSLVSTVRQAATTPTFAWPHLVVGNRPRAAQEYIGLKSPRSSSCHFLDTVNCFQHVLSGQFGRKWPMRFPVESIAMTVVGSSPSSSCRDIVPYQATVDGVNERVFAAQLVALQPHKLNSMEAAFRTATPFTDAVQETDDQAGPRTRKRPSLFDKAKVTFSDSDAADELEVIMGEQPLMALDDNDYIASPDKEDIGNAQDSKSLAKTRKRHEKRKKRPESASG